MLKDQCDNVHFKEDVTADDGIRFHYRLQQGPATSRNGLLLLENMKFPSQVAAAAEKRAKHFDQTQEWLYFEK